ncbi:MAG: SAM-dependent methyltransferase [Lachnospiraceae bacterium]|nr:SAM-dependent methyltransferase [Lachnospiraceae bacterium]
MDEKDFGEYLTDARLHIKTIGRIEDYANDHIYPYEPTSYSVLERLADSGLIRGEDHLLDYGCGKGRTLIYFHDRIGCRGTGVELMRDFYELAVANKTAYEKDICKPKGGTCGIDFSLGEAQKYDVPASVNRVFFFNPFSAVIFDIVMQNLVQSFYETKRHIMLFLYYPQDAYIAALARTEEVQFFDEIDCTDLFTGRDARNRIMIFEIN